MRFIPGWLHSRLLRFAWYRRKCGVREMSPELMAIWIKAMAVGLPLSNDVSVIPESFKSGATVVAWKPRSYIRSSTQGSP